MRLSSASIAVLTLAVAGAVFTGHLWAQRADQKPELPSQDAKPSGVLTGPATDRFSACLPEGIKVDDVVSAPSLKSAAGAGAGRVTIGDTLSRLKAHCRKRTLVDGADREIRFHRLIGCWGNPPDDYLEQQARQSLEIQRLKKNFTVVEIPCGQIDPRRIG